jgi:predicted secreted protein
VCYGAVRTTYQPGLARIFQLEELFGNGSDQQAFLAKPAFSLLNLLLVLLFALSCALLLTAIHTDLQNLPLLRQFFNVPETAIVARVLLYTAIITAFVFGKYVYVGILGYTFGLQPLVDVQYREFLRTTLLAGLVFPAVLLLYLGLNTGHPQAVAVAASSAIALVLVGTVLRVGHTLHQHASLLNLHLFAYLCATEVLPLLVLLKLIVFAY